MIFSRLIRSIFNVLLLWGVSTGFCQAHHSMSPHYDSSKAVSISGIVTEFHFINPHAFVYLDVEQADGSVVNWNCEMQPSAVLSRKGWTKEIFAPGTRVSIEGIASRKDPHGCAFVSAVTDSGIDITNRGNLSGAIGTNQAIAAVTDNRAEAEGLFGLWRTGSRYMPLGDLSGDLTSVAADEPRPSLEAFGTPENPLGLYAEYLTEQGKQAAAAYDARVDDPALFCSGASIMRAWAEPAGISEISQQGDQIIIKHEYMDVVRTIHMDSRSHPAHIEPSMTGHSVGWFEGEELVIDTLGFAAGVLFPHPGVLHSDQLHVVERLRISEDGNHLIREYVATDPLYFSKPMRAKVVWNRSDKALQRYDCDATATSGS